MHTHNQSKKVLEPSTQQYVADTKKAVTTLQQTLDWVEEDAMVAQVNLEKAADKDDVTKAVLERQYAFKMGLYEHFSGLLQTARAEGKVNCTRSNIGRIQLYRFLKIIILKTD